MWQSLSHHEAKLLSARLFSEKVAARCPLRSVCFCQVFEYGEDWRSCTIPDITDSTHLSGKKLTANTEKPSAQYQKSKIPQNQNEAIRIKMVDYVKKNTYISHLKDLKLSLNP